MVSPAEKEVKHSPALISGGKSEPSSKSFDEEILYMVLDRSTCAINQVSRLSGVQLRHDTAGKEFYRKQSFTEGEIAECELPHQVGRP